ncbi:MAG TPA: hypothetical protein VIQ60_11205 [Gemmatimonadaceae bacterium]|jgi:hypothetical protein
MKQGRSLTIQRSIVPLSDRKKYMHKLRARKAYYTSAKCRFWVFEETDLAGAFIEFIEAEDPALLAKALAEAPESLVDASRIYQEVELD